MKLIEYLQQHNLTRAEFARRLGTSRSNVTRWISNGSTPDPRQIANIQRHTGGLVTLLDWASGDDPTNTALARSPN